MKSNNNFKALHHLHHLHHLSSRACMKPHWDSSGLNIPLPKKVVKVVKVVHGE